MPNRMELQGKGKGCSRNKLTGEPIHTNQCGRGDRADIRNAKHAEAVERNSKTPEHLRRSYWKAQGYSRMSASSVLHLARNS